MTSETISQIKASLSASGEEKAQPGRLRGRQRQAWDRIAASVGDLRGAPSTEYYRRCEIALIGRSFGDLRGKRVLKLDLWNEAFNTRILHWMADQGAETYGLDLSNVVAHQARRNTAQAGQPVRLMRADIRELPFPDNSFDAVYTMGTIEHIDEYVQAIDEVRRVLRPGGRAIIGVPHKWNIFLRPALVWFLDLFGKYAYSPEKSFSAPEFRQVIERTGLVVNERTGILSIPGLLRLADVFCFTRRIALYRLSPIALWPFERLETRFRWPGRFGYLMAMVVEKRASTDGARPVAATN
ncbi:MAG: class I SAM-dependent methyltransferase [Thermoanaerobaculia bacterium]